MLVNNPIICTLSPLATRVHALPVCLALLLIITFYLLFHIAVLFKYTTIFTRRTFYSLLFCNSFVSFFFKKNSMNTMTKKRRNKNNYQTNYKKMLYTHLIHFVCTCNFVA